MPDTGQEELRSSDVLVTADIDWAPDWMIEEMVARLKRARVRATLFATHKSPFLDTLRSDPDIQIGIHPNFLAGSSHGDTPEEVLGTMLDWYPSAKAVRTHSLVQSEPLLGLMANRFGLAIDCSLHLPETDHITPHRLTPIEGGATIVRVPHVFQDNMHMHARGAWTVNVPWLVSPGLKVFNFHPVHISLNSSTTDAYNALKRVAPLQEVSRHHVSQVEIDAPGTGTMFNALLDCLAGKTTYTISQRVEIWLKEKFSL